MSGTKILVLTGPTASGKTALSIALAQALGGEVVSADSMQIYKGMDIGTAKPTMEERQGVPHYMMDMVEPSENYSVAAYVQDATTIIEDIASRGKVPLVVGGTGLYIDALIRGSAFAPAPQDGALRQELEQRICQYGGQVLLEELAKVDPETAQRLFPNDHKRIVRGLEIFQLTGKTKSQFDRESKEVVPHFDACMVGLQFLEREDLRQRIYRRVDLMMELGLMAEVESFFHLPQDCTAMQAIGYKELRGVLTGEDSLDEAVALLKLRSRQYAKRQLTWLRNKIKANWYTWEKIPNIQNALQVSTSFWDEFLV